MPWLVLRIHIYATAYLAYRNFLTRVIGTPLIPFVFAVQRPDRCHMGISYTLYFPRYQSVPYGHCSSSLFGQPGFGQVCANSPLIVNFARTGEIVVNPRDLDNSWSAPISIRYDHYAIQARRQDTSTWSRANTSTPSPPYLWLLFILSKTG